MSYLIDTSWAIEYLRGNQNVAQRLRSMRSDGLAVSIVTVAELYSGVFLSNNPANNEGILSGFLNEVIIIGIDRSISRVFGMEEARLRRIGITMGDLDLLIVSTALHYDLTLLTSDSDFQRVEGLQTIFL